MYPSIEKRKGQFSVSTPVIEEMIKNPYMMEKVFCNFIIVRAEHHLVTDSVVYEAFSPLFEEVEKHGKVPEYRINIQTNELQEIVDVTAEKVEG